MKKKLFATVGPIDTILTTGAPPPVAIFNDNYDFVGHVVQAPSWKNLKLCTSLSLKPLHGKNLNMAHCQLLPMGNKIC